MSETFQSPHPLPTSAVTDLILPAHAERVLTPRGISAEFAADFGVRSITVADDLPEAFRDHQRASIPGLIFTWRSPTAGEMLQYRPDNPPLIDDRVAKYIFPTGATPVLNELRRQGDTLLLVEGTMQSLAAAQYAPDGVAVYGMAGCWGWRVGESGTSIPDLGVVEGTDVIVVLDADASSNLDVYNAGMSLSAALHAEGATTVRFLRLPAGKKAGLDDVLGAREAGKRSSYITNLIGAVKGAKKGEFDKPAATKPKAKKEEKTRPMPAGKRQVDATDLDVADVFVDVKGQHLRFDSSNERWLTYHGGLWDPDSGLTLAKSRFRDLIKNDIVAVREDDQGELIEARDWLYCSPRITHVLHHASTNPAVHVHPDDMDQDPWLWNAANCVINLRTGEVVAHSPELLMTMQSQVVYDPDAKAPHFDAFLDEVLPNLAVRRYVQQVLGLSLVGEVRKHIFPVFIGSGRNGKGTMIRLVRAIFGAYSSGISKSLLVETKFQEHSTIVTTLYKKRLVTTEELSAKQSWNLSSVKELTGGDWLQGRRMREEEFWFKPSHTLLLSTNARPQINDSDEGAEAFWARYREIPFTVKIENPDQEVEDRLYQELPGILNWLLDGLDDYLEHGLVEPPEVTMATVAARVAADPMHKFFEEELVRTDDEEDQVSNVDMHEHYVKWCGRQVPRVKPLAINAYSRKLCNASGLAMPERMGNKNVRTWVGVQIASGDQDSGGGATDSATGFWGDATGSRPVSATPAGRMSSQFTGGASADATDATGFPTHSTQGSSNAATTAPTQNTTTPYPRGKAETSVAPVAPVAAPPSTSGNSCDRPEEQSVAEPVAVAQPVASPRAWADLLRPLATVVDPHTTCPRCGEDQVADDELGVFQLCPACTDGTLRPRTTR